MILFGLALMFSVQKGFATGLSKLERMKASSPSGLIKLSVDDFQQLVETSPRSYSLFVLFSADSNLCAPCGAITKRLSQITKDYYALPSSRTSSRPVFFSIVRVTMEDQVFLMRYGLRHVPVFYHFKAGKSRDYPRHISDQSSDNFPIQQIGYSTNAMKEFINSRSGSRLHIVRGNYQIPFVQTVKDLMPFILLTIAILAAGILATGAYKSPMLWFGIVVLIYIFSVGGGHYSWINNTPLANVNVNGEYEFISGGSRSQYVAEGFFVSAMCVSISILVILIQEMPSIIPNKSGQQVIGMVLSMMTGVAITALGLLYQMKMPQYLHYN
ncbi:unnamed protein product [Agarophyton chilense]